MKQLLKPLFLVFLCVWSLSLHADVFKGIVIDAETRQPLSGVTIKAIQSGQGSDNWTITNDYAHRPSTQCGPSWHCNRPVFK